MNKIKHWIFSSVMLLIFASGYSQGVISGIIKDGEMNTPLPGASVIIKGTSKGASTDFDGKYLLMAPNQKGTLVISYIGFTSQEVEYTIVNGVANINVNLKPDAQSLDEVIVVGSGVVDFVKDRQTPIAATTIGAAIIQEKVGNMEFPEILSKTPSIYATKGKGGFGDSKISVRGFDQTNVAVIINGQPVNDMENGSVYWSNWAGLSDVASAVQVQRGLGASKLAVPSVGGTINVLTRSADKKEGGIIKAMIGNDGFFKSIAGYNTGVNKKGWSASFLLGRTQGNGYVTGLEFEGYTYLASIGYKPSDKHSFNFNFTGAAQWHNQRYTTISIRDFMNFGGDDFRRFNADWGYREGKGYSLQKNFYNKPIASLNWDWKINDKWELSSVIYGSWGRGGGTRPRGNTKITDVRRDENLTKIITSGEAPYRDSKTGMLLFDKIILNNLSGTPFIGEGDYKGLILGSDGKFDKEGVNKNAIIRASSMNSHDWYGAISNLKYEYENWTFGTGIDLRAYSGYHYMNINDLLGLSGYYSNNKENKNLSTGVIVSETYKTGIFDDTGLQGQKIGHYNIGDVKWGGINFISEYKSDKLSGVLQAGLSNQGYKRIDYFKAIDYTSDTKNILGGFAKGGLNYNINDKNNVFFNAGYIERQPKFNTVFPNYKNDINPHLRNEQIISYELGYGLKTTFVNLSLNLYSTTWSNRSTSKRISTKTGRGIANFFGIEQRHQGVELETKIRPLSWLNVNAMLSVGNWIYTKDIKADIFDDNQVKLDEATLYLKDTKVGGVAQTTANVGLEIKPIDRLTLDTSWQYVSNLYGDFNADDDTFLKSNNKGPIKLPAYNLFDAGVSYKFDLNSKMNLGLRLNVNNIFDTVYIAESSTNIHTTPSSKTYQEIDEKNKVWFGFGRTWNFSINLRF